MFGRNRILTLLVALAAAVVLAAPAMAQDSPTTQVYGGDQGDVAGVVTPGGGGDGTIPPADAPPTRTERGAGTPVTASAGELPFTGFEALIVGLAGLALVGTGVALRRSTRSQS